MKKLLGAAMVLAALMALGVAAAAAGTGGTDRPFKGALTGFATVAPDPSCPIGLRTDSEGSGTASHLGRVSMTSSHCTPAPDAFTGRMTIVAANGDELYMTYSGTSEPLPPVGGVILAPSHNVIVGGTGRFADATGEADFTALVTFAGLGVPLPITWTWDGTISY
jgi:hypothetical protein